MDQNVSAAVPGVTTVEEIEECAAVMGASFSKRNLDELKQYQSFLKGRICTMCGGCSGECPYEVSHTDLLRVVMYHDGYQNDKLAREALGETDTLQNLQRWSECSSCSVICRRGLDIRAQIQWAQQISTRLT
jgi:ferredoxin